MATLPALTSATAVGLVSGAGATSARPVGPTSGSDFARELADATGLRFSAHAQRRLASRNLRLNEQQLASIARATDQAAARGARDSLLLLEGLALVVNVPNRTVVTALDPTRMQNGIVTNIDATVFVTTGES